MWLSRPVYESLPYVYAAVGVAALGASWLLRAPALATTLFIFGALALTAGIMVWLRRRDFRSQWTQYNWRSLDEV